MFSPEEPDQVLVEIGNDFLTRFASSVVATREDVDDMRGFRPSWFLNMHVRTLSNIIHDRLWDQMMLKMKDAEGIYFFEKGSTREVQVGDHFRFRIKRHNKGEQLSCYETPTALAFFRQDMTLPGLELTTLSAGYHWEPDLAEILAPVISYRDGKNNPIWGVELSEPQGATAIEWTPITTPSLPTIDFGAASVAADEPEADGA